MEYTPLTQLAQELGMDRSNMRKYVIKNGFSIFKIRTPESKSQLTLALTHDDANSVRTLRQTSGYNNTMKSINNSIGHFYIIQLIPEYAPNRIKFGFASDVDNRLSAHRTSAPTATLVKAWPCKREWELCAIASITRKECKLVANEVYECENLILLVKRTDNFFSIMPS